MNDSKDTVARFFFSRWLEFARESFKEGSPEFALFYCNLCRNTAKDKRLGLNSLEETKLKLVENSASLLLAKNWWDIATDKDCPCNPGMAMQFCSEFLGRTGLSSSALGITQVEFDKIEQQLGR